MKKRASGATWPSRHKMVVWWAALDQATDVKPNSTWTKSPQEFSWATPTVSISCLKSRTLTWIIHVVLIASWSLETHMAALSGNLSGVRIARNSIHMKRRYRKLYQAWKLRSSLNYGLMMVCSLWIIKASAKSMISFSWLKTSLMIGAQFVFLQNGPKPAQVACPSTTPLQERNDTLRTPNTYLNQRMTAPFSSHSAKTTDESWETIKNLRSTHSQTKFYASISPYLN